MKQFFDERVLGAREGRPGGEGARERIDREERESEIGWDFRGEGRYLDLFSRIGFLRAGGVTVSAVFTSRGNYIKSFCKGREN